MNLQDANTMLLVPKRNTKTAREIDAHTNAIGARIAAIRKRQGLTQVELAQRLKIGQSLVSMYEQGRCRIGADVVARVAGVLKVSTDEILSDKPHKGNGEAFPSPKLMRRLVHFPDLSPKKQQALLQTIDAFLVPASRGAR